LEEEEIGERHLRGHLRLGEEILGVGRKEAGDGEEGMGNEESWRIGFLLVDAERGGGEEFAAQRGECGVEVFEEEEKAAGVFVEVAGDEACTRGGEIKHGEIGARHARERGTAFWREIVPFFDEEEIVGAFAGEIFREVCLVKRERIEDEAEEGGKARLVRGEERGPDDGADEKVFVEAEGAAVADGGGGDGEHGEGGGERIEVEGSVGVGGEFAHDGWETRKDGVAGCVVLMMSEMKNGGPSVYSAGGEGFGRVFEKSGDFYFYKRRFFYLWDVMARCVRGSFVRGELFR
jgi:hypothetical protein